MKRILLFGKFDSAGEGIDKELAKHFSVQTCEPNSDEADGVIRVFEPDLIIVSLDGEESYDRGFVDLLSGEYSKPPVLTIGADPDQDGLKDILEAICSRLGLKLVEEGDGFSVTDSDMRKNVLVVDDSPVTLRELKSMLSDDFDVTVATSGLQAMTSIGKRRPDLIILDYEMPVCDGPKTLEMIRSDEDLGDMPVIFLTGVNDKKHLENVLKLKPAGYLLKPADKEKLLSLIGMII